MPEILADEQAGAAEARIESAEGIACGQEASLVENGVGGQVNLVMNVDDLAA